MQFATWDKIAMCIIILNAVANVRVLISSTPNSDAGSVRHRISVCEITSMELEVLDLAYKIYEILHMRSKRVSRQHVRFLTVCHLV